MHLPTLARARGLSLLIVGSVACAASSGDATPTRDDESAAKATPEPAAKPEPPSPEPATPEPAPPPTVGPPGAGDPVAAYRQILAAYNAHDADAYIAGFTEELVCFYGDANHPRAKLAKARAPLVEGQHTIPELAFVSHASVDLHQRDDSHAVLVDFGYTTAEGKTAVVHHKAVLMQLVDGTWKIAGETAPTDAGCLGDMAQGIVAPLLLEPCRKQAKACDCAPYCKNPMSNGCDSCFTGCENELAECLGIPP